MTPGVGGRSVSRILARNELLGRDSVTFLRLGAEALREEYRLSPRAANNLTENLATRLTELRELEVRLNRLGVSLVTTADAHYPAMIEEMDPDPPGVIFLYGNHKLLESNTFCVLSSRNARAAELELIERWSEEGVLAGEVLVTGHDRPEYQRSAVVPLRWGSPRILCLDRGLFKVLGADLKDEAFRTARLWRYEFDPTTDLVVSPFRPESDFFGVNNKIRDRLVGCLSKRLRFVTMSAGGNMARIARTALQAKRKVEVNDMCDDARELSNMGATLIDALKYR